MHAKNIAALFEIRKVAPECGGRDANEILELGET